MNLYNKQKQFMSTQSTKLTDELENQVNNLMKRIKQRQQQHRKIYQYNNRIIASRQQLEQNIFIHDQICKYRTFINQRKAIELSFSVGDQQLNMLCNKIEEDGKEFMSILIKRVSSRVLEIAYSSIQIVTDPIQYYLVSYNNFKIHILEIISHNKEVRLGVLVKIFSKFFNHKINVELERLKEAIYCLQVGDFSILQNLKQNFYMTLLRIEYPQKLEDNVESPKRMLRKISPVKQTMNQKKVAYDKTKIAQRQFKNNQKSKKNILKKLVNAISDVMQICKQQLLEDLLADNKNWESRRMFTDLLDRNKINSSHLQQFRAKSDDLEEAITRKDMLIKPVQYDEKEYPQNQQENNQQKIRQNHVQNTRKTTSVSVKGKRSSQPLLSRKQIKCQTINLFNGKSKPISSCHWMTVNNIEQSDHLVKQKVFVSQKQLIHETDFIEINIKPPNNNSKQRLPQIYARATSVDAAKFAKKKHIIKVIEKEMKMKNIKNDQGQKQINLASKSPKQKPINVISRQKMENKISLELKSLGTNFFDEIDRKISYYCEMKKNLMC